MAQLGIGDFKRRCMAPFECQNGRIQGMEVGYGCKCANDDMTPSACQFCSFRANEFGQHCTRCLGGTYLHENRCIPSCDGIDGLVAYAPGNFGRECRAPFRCSEGDPGQYIDPEGNPCRCSRELRESGCGTCMWTAAGATCV